MSLAHTLLSAAGYPLGDGDPDDRTDEELLADAVVSALEVMAGRGISGETAARSQAAYFGLSLAQVQDCCAQAGHLVAYLGPEPGPACTLCGATIAHVKEAIR